MKNWYALTYSPVALLPVLWSSDICCWLTSTCGEKAVNGLKESPQIPSTRCQGDVGKPASPCSPSQLLREESTSLEESVSWEQWFPANQLLLSRMLGLYHKKKQEKHKQGLNPALMQTLILLAEIVKIQARGHSQWKLSSYWKELLGLQTLNRYSTLSACPRHFDSPPQCKLKNENRINPINQTQTQLSNYKGLAPLTGGSLSWSQLSINTDQAFTLPFKRIGCYFCDKEALRAFGEILSFAH